MKRITRWALGLLAIAAAAVFIWWKTRPQPLELLVRKVEKGTVEKTVANTRAGTVSACRRANLSRTRLVAPFSGLVAEIEGELNEYVTPSSVGGQNSPCDFFG